MRSRLELVRRVLDSAFGVLSDNQRALTLDEALFVPPGGYRSIIGVIKHTAAWSHVYRSYAFDAAPTHWTDISWPYGLRDTIMLSEAYLADLVGWLVRSHELWLQDLDSLHDADLDELRPLHWGEKEPLADIVLRIASHHVYHAGEINMLLSLCRQEAWEEGEEVEENHISTLGHRVIPPWRREAPPANDSLPACAG